MTNKEFSKKREELESPVIRMIELTGELMAAEQERCDEADNLQDTYMTAMAEVMNTGSCKDYTYEQIMAVSRKSCRMRDEACRNITLLNNYAVGGLLKVARKEE